MTDATGVATFSGLSIDKAGTNYTLVASSSGLSNGTSSQFTIVVGSASALAFTTQPSDSTGGLAFPTQPVVKFQDAGGNNVGAGTGSVALTLQNATGVTLTCASNPVTAVAGTATFSTCKVDRAGTYTLLASSGTLMNAQSASFKVTVGSPVRLAFSTQPGNGSGGTALTTQPAVAVLDAGGNVATSSAAVTLALTAANGGALTCAANPVNAASGIATFSGCLIDKVGTYTLTASATGLTAATSGSVAITAGPAVALCFVSTSATTCLSGTQNIGSGSTFSGRVLLVDAGNNPVAATTKVDVSLSANGNGDLSAPSPTTVSIAAGASVSSSTFSSKLANGASKSGVLTGHTATVGLADATVTIHA